MRIGGEGDPGALQKGNWEQFAGEAGIKPRLVMARLIDMAQRVQVARMRLFKGEFARYRCDALYRLMELIDGQAEKTLRKLS